MSDNALNHLPLRPSVNDVLGVEHLLVTPEKVIVRIAVNEKTHQPFGILHGGVSALLAEGAASVGGAVSIPPGKIVVGTELNCSHLRSVSSGHITATATPIRKGRSVHVWAIDVHDDDNRLICVSRCTLQVLDAPGAGETTA